MENKNIWGFVGRFTAVYVIIYTVTAMVFLHMQNALPAVGRVGLDLFQPYSIDFRGILAQIIIGALIALVLYPFYEVIVKEKSGWLVLFAALWGIGILGSLEPRPGSIEGMLYTEITLIEHILVLG